MRSKLIGILASICLVSATAGDTVAFQESEITTESPTEIAKEVHILTHDELSMLYTCNPEERVEDPNIIELDPESALLLMAVSELEHGDGSVEAQATDMLAIYNRIKSDDFPDNIRDIVYQEGQFSTVKKDLSNFVPDEDSHRALAMIECGLVHHDALYFEAVGVKDSWMSRNREVSFVYGGHRYYR